MKVINLFGAPGVGKTTVRSGLFWQMKSAGLHVEEISEYAKYLLQIGQGWQLEHDQLTLLSRQHHRQLVLRRAGLDFAVTDSPLLLCPFYAKAGYYPAFEALTLQAHRAFDNANFFLTPSQVGPDYDPRFREPDGRRAQNLSRELQAYLTRLGVSYQPVEVGVDAPRLILDVLLRQNGG